MGFNSLKPIPDSRVLYYIIPIRRRIAAGKFLYTHKRLIKKYVASISSRQGFAFAPEQDCARDAECECDRDGLEREAVREYGGRASLQARRPQGWRVGAAMLAGRAVGVGSLVELAQVHEAESVRLLDVAHLNEGIRFCTERATCRPTAVPPRTHPSAVSTLEPDLKVTVT